MVYRRSTKVPSHRSCRQGPLLSNNARGKLTEQDIALLRKYGTKIKTDRVEVRVDNRTESIDVGGPFNQTIRPFAGKPRRILRAATER